MFRDSKWAKCKTFVRDICQTCHFGEDNLRPVIYYVKHLLQDPDEDEMLSRAMISYVRFNHPQTITHPILTFSLDLLWERMAKHFFLKDRVLTIFNCALAHFHSPRTRNPKFSKEVGSA